jgi:hypothetical protein
MPTTREMNDSIVGAAKATAAKAGEIGKKVSSSYSKAKLPLRPFDRMKAAAKKVQRAKVAKRKRTGKTASSYMEPRNAAERAIWDRYEDDMASIAKKAHAK